MEISNPILHVLSHEHGLAVRCKFEVSASDVSSDAVAHTAAVGVMDGLRSKQQAAHRPWRWLKQSLKLRRRQRLEQSQQRKKQRQVACMLSDCCLCFVGGLPCSRTPPWFHCSRRPPCFRVYKPPHAHYFRRPPCCRVGDSCTYLQLQCSAK